MISRTSLILISLLFLSKMGISQSPAKPKLIIGIVVDQMRFDYLYKYWDRYGDGGFKKLVNEGFQCKNLQYNYVPTYTGPGHTSIYTGTTPERHGIVSNDWYEIKSKKSVYCAEDKTVSTVGAETVGVGRMSPVNLLSTTIGDELRVATNLRSRVFGIALKDRASILPAGHIANAAYWFDSKTGNWVSSSYYMEKLPDWLRVYNQTQPAMNYLRGSWETLYDIKSYNSSKPDSNSYEKLFNGKSSATFPYNLAELMPLNEGQELIRTTPFGNTITREMAIELIKQEKLGKDKFSDMLCISFSSTDYVGHHFGTDAIETEDTYLRLDEDLAKLLKFLDEWVGEENVLVFLTADHGGATVPSYLMDLKVPGGYMNYSVVARKTEAWIKDYCGLDSVLLKLTNDQLYLDEKAVIKAGKNPKELQQLLADSILQLDGIHCTSTATKMINEEYTQGIKNLMQKGFYPKRSGQVLMSMEPNWIEYAKSGTTHGSAYSYDTRVPMLWYGWKINSGSTADSYFIDDIAPTLSWLLNIPFPNACSGNPIRIPLKQP